MSALIAALASRHGLPTIDADTFDAFLTPAVGDPDHALLFFTGDPDQRSDSGDVAVVLPELGWELLMPMFAGVILGGIGSPVGAVLGIVTFSIAQEVASLYVGPAYKIVLAFFILLVVLLLRPQGMLGRPIAAR